MSGQFGQIVFVIWRESVEALLVIGILHAWLARQADPTTARAGRHYLWLGVLAGLGLAVALAAILLFFAENLPEGAQDYFMTAMVLIAAALILQMVFWLRRHGRSLKTDLEAGLDQAAAQARHWGLFILAMLAVAREGSETVVFLYGILAAGASSLGPTLGGIAIGLAAALFTYWLLQYGSKHLSWRLFFRVTEVMLLLLACSLVMNGADHLYGLGLLPFLGGTVWDSSFLLDDGNTFGGLVSALTGYRARPDVLSLVVFAVYWALVLWRLSRSRAVLNAGPNGLATQQSRPRASGRIGDQEKAL
jgi:high-affinity iron transporter